MPQQQTRQPDLKPIGAPQFLSGRRVWQEIKRRSERSTGQVQAAVAYFGKDGAKLLTLKAGDILLVDMSMRAVRQGVTDPREIKKLMRKGVEVFSREGLHAKFYIIDGALICGSANVSTRSSMVLDEAAIVTRDHSSVRQAKAYLNSMCSEPVSDLYLKQCIKEYQPPWFTAARGSPAGKHKARYAKVWFISGLTDDDLPEGDRETVDNLEEEASMDITAKGHEVSWLRFPYKPTYFDSIQRRNWILSCTRDGGGRRSVECPNQVLNKRTYRNARGTKIYMLMLSKPVEGESIAFSKFRKRVRLILPRLSATRPRTCRVGDPATADALLRAWTRTGRLKGGLRS